MDLGIWLAENVQPVPYGSMFKYSKNEYSARHFWSAPMATEWIAAVLVRTFTHKSVQRNVQ